MLLPLEAPIVSRKTPLQFPRRRLPCAFRCRLLNVCEPCNRRARLGIFYCLAEFDKLRAIAVLSPVQPFVERVVTHASILRRMSISRTDGERRANALLHIRRQP